MKKKLASIALSTIMLGTLTGGIQDFQVKAASLTNVQVTLDQYYATTPAEAYITFTPSTPLTNGTVINVSYDTQFTGGEYLLDTDIRLLSTDPDFVVGHETNIGAGHFTSTLTSNGDITGPIMIRIDNEHLLSNPKSTGKYLWTISTNYPGVKAMASTIDTGSAYVYVGGWYDNPVTDLNVNLNNYNTNSQSTVLLTYMPTTPNTFVTNGTIIDVNYDPAFTGGASLTDNDIRIIHDGVVLNSVESNFTAGHFTSTLNNNYPYGYVGAYIIEIGNVQYLTNPSTAGTYRWIVTGDIGGTGTNVQTADEFVTITNPSRFSTRR